MVVFGCFRAAFSVENYLLRASSLRLCMRPLSGSLGGSMGRWVDELGGLS